MPDFALQGLDGRSASLHEYAGKVVLLNFWATWCAPCRSEMDSLQHLSRALPDTQVAVLGIAVDEDVNLVREHVLRGGWQFARFVDPEQLLSRSRLAVDALPRTYVIGPDGRIELAVSGARDWSAAGVIELLRRLAGADQRRA
jgi:peroxiredoxin